jgi:hypothetical protein
MSRKEIAERVLSTLSNGERDKSVIYLDTKELPAGSTIEIAEREVRLPWQGVLAFIDLEPQANWGHACRYLLFDRASGEMLSFEAQFPPYLRGPSETLTLLWKGPSAPEWAVVTHEK